MRIFSVLICLIIVSFSSVSASYKSNVDDEIKIRAFTKKLEKYLEKFKNWDELKLKYQKIISEKLWKNHDDLKSFWPNWYNEYKSFKEYFLMNIYDVFTRLNDTDLYNVNQYPDFKILENDYIKTIGRSDDLHIDNNSLYSTSKYNVWYKSDHLLFIKIDKEISLLEYLEQNILEDEFKSKCDIVENTSKHMMYWNKNWLYFKANKEFVDTLKQWEWPNCWEYSSWVFTRISETLVFYKPYPIEYVGLDFSLIEIKD